MKWVQRNNTWLSAPYSVIRDTRGYSAWLNEKGRYGRLGAEMPSLEKAQSFCEAQAAKEKATV